MNTVIGTGVTFFITAQGGRLPLPVIMTNVNSFALMAPVTGTYKGILIFQNPAISYRGGNIFTSLGGNGATGALYFPTTNIIYTGTGQPIYHAIVAQTVTLTGANIFLKDSTGTKTGLIHTSLGLINCPLPEGWQQFVRYIGRIRIAQMNQGQTHLDRRMLR